MFGKYFYGNEISEYGQEHGFVDYGTLAKAFDAVLNNEIMPKTWEIGYWEQESGFVDNEDEIEELKDKIDELDEDEDNAEIEALKAKIEELEDEQAEIPEIYQYYIVSDNGARILEEFNEIVFYNEELDMYLWGVTHYGTSWDYVLTDIPCNASED
jgi:hypothetical protein